MSKVKWQLGTVIWFDEYSGEGQVRGDDGKDFFVHYSAIDSKQKWKKLKAEEEVRFIKSPDPHRRHAIKVKGV